MYCKYKQASAMDRSISFLTRKVNRVTPRSDQLQCRVAGSPKRRQKKKRNIYMFPFLLSKSAWTLLSKADYLDLVSTIKKNHKFD
jgi:hypothetical protein